MKVLVEENAGLNSKFLNADYEASGATIVNREKLFAETDIILKVRPPLLDTETKLLRNDSTMISFLFPAQNKQLIDELAKKRLNVFAMDCIPRISRAQVFDALSSMANIAGYDLLIIFNYSNQGFFSLQTDTKQLLKLLIILADFLLAKLLPLVKFPRQKYW